MTSSPADPTLRQLILSVSVLEDVDLEPADGGVLVEGCLVDWFEVQQTCGPHAPTSVAARRRIADLLRLRAWVARAGREAAEAVTDSARLLALPVDHVDHLGPAWSRRPVAGGALWCGLGLATAGEPGGRVVPLPASVLQASGAAADAVHAQAHRRAAAMSQTAAELLVSSWSRTGQLGRVGDSDVLTLLALPGLRRALADADGVGMRTVAVPDRGHGWYDMSRIDPEYLPMAWQLTDAQDRGVGVPLLVTWDEVVAVRPWGSRRGGDDVSRPWAAPA